MFIHGIPKPKFHHPDVFPKGGASIQSTTSYSEQYARHFFQVSHLENKLKITIRAGFKRPCPHAYPRKMWIR
jgi:hypothetical protein|tara:strand:- start:391 stop:606 length:216 start_codon:yes stop_codon:yes gene_type:complete